MGQKYMLVIDDCDFCGNFIERLADKLSSGELQVANILEQQKFRDWAADLEIVEYPTIVEEFDDGNVCILDDFDWNVVKKCKNDRCPIKPTTQPETTAIEI